MQTIYLHMDQKSDIPELYAKQRDVGRKFQAVVTDGSEDYRIPEDVRFSVWYSGTSGEGHYSEIGGNSAFLVEGNTVTVELITQMLANKGGGILCLAMNAADGTQIGLWDIPYIAEALPGADSAEAQQYYDVFSEAVAGALDAAARAENAVQTMVPDATLSVAGRAADADAVGRALAGKSPADFGAITPETDDEDGFMGVIESCLSLMSAGEVRHVSIHYHGRHSITLHKHLSAGYADIEDISYQFAATSSTYYYKRVRSLYSGTWKDWEYVNPPMNEGPEYRTTERFKGYPVYTMLYNMGALANNSYKYKKILADGCKIIRAAVCAQSDAVYVTVPYESEGQRLWYYATETSPVIYSNFDATAYNAWVQIWYTKD